MKSGGMFFAWRYGQITEDASQSLETGEVMTDIRNPGKVMRIKKDYAEGAHSETLVYQYERFAHGQR